VKLFSRMTRDRKMAAGLRRETIMTLKWIAQRLKMGKLDARIELFGREREEMKVSKVRTDPFRGQPIQFFRMDVDLSHERNLHDNEIAIWDDPPFFSYHVNRF
jgi:hypothetical protein